MFRGSSREITLGNRKKPKMRLFSTLPLLVLAQEVEYDYYFTSYDPDTGEVIGERKATDGEICQYRKGENEFCVKVAVFM